MKKKILFVEDNPTELKNLQKMASCMSGEWEIQFASEAGESLEILRKDSNFDVLVTGIGAVKAFNGEFLNCVRDRYPLMIRILISNRSEQTATLKSFAPAHQYLLKPVNLELLKSSIARAFAMRGLLEDELLMDAISRMESLPSLPSLYAEVVAEINTPNCSLKKIGEIISKDLAMSAKILQLANSAFFGHPQAVTSISGAIIFLGLETIKAVILSVKVFSLFKCSKAHESSISKLWDHSIATGMVARTIATQNDLDQVKIDEAFMAGLLHDVGKLVLWDRIPNIYREIAAMEKSSGCPLWQAEQQILGTGHAQVGAYLMGLWGLSESMVDAIAFHHFPSKSPNQGFSTLTIVHLANSIEHGQNPDGSGDRLDSEYLEKLGFKP